MSIFTAERQLESIKSMLKEVRELLDSNVSLKLLNDCVEQYVDKLEQDYRSGKVSDCNLCSEIRKIKVKIRKKIANRSLWLHSRDPHVIGLKQSQCAKPNPSASPPATPSGPSTEQTGSVQVI